MLSTIVQGLLSSLLLIEIEGGGIWARNLPTFRVWEDLTLFHVYKVVLCVFVQILIHGHNFIFHTALHFLSEDAFYIILNPFLGLHKFSRDHVHQYRVWWWGYPKHMWAYTLLMLLTDPLALGPALLLLLVGLAFADSFAPLHYAWYFRVHPRSA